MRFADSFNIGVVVRSGRPGRSGRSGREGGKGEQDN